jgi:hypothetical protein
MSRRCKPGQRARIISEGTDRGKIVLVVRPYFYPEEVSDATWPRNIAPWVVTSLGALLHSVSLKTGKEAPPARTMVMDDRDLEPLDDDDDPAVDEAAKRPTKSGARAGKPKALAAGNELAQQ